MTFTSADWVSNLTLSLLIKEEKDGEKSGNAEAEKDVEKKAKPQKKSKISEDITVELIIRDIVDPTADDVTSSKKKYSNIWISFHLVLYCCFCQLKKVYIFIFSGCKIWQTETWPNRKGKRTSTVWKLLSLRHRWAAKAKQALRSCQWSLEKILANLIPRS